MASSHPDAPAPDPAAAPGPPNPRANAAPRIFAALLALPLSFFTFHAVPGALRGGFDAMSVAFAALFSTGSIFCWWFALRGHLKESRRRMTSALAGGFILGAVGFLGGFFGPIVLTPDANQGPLLGIFVTGPLGFVIGAAAGWLYSLRRRRA